MAASPATPPPITSTFPGSIFPAPVAWPAEKTRNPCRHPAPPLGVRPVRVFAPFPPPRLPHHLKPQFPEAQHRLRRRPDPPLPRMHLTRHANLHQATFLPTRPIRTGANMENLVRHNRR